MSDKYYLFNIKPVMELARTAVRAITAQRFNCVRLKPAPVAGFIFSVFLSPIFLKMLAILICLVYLSDKYYLYYELLVSICN